VGFPGPNNIQTWVAQDRGLFKREGLVVDFATTKGSVVETKDLFAGKYQIMSSDFDNIVADIEGQGEQSFPDAADLVAVMGVHSGLESLVSRPEIRAAKDLRGKTVAADAARSGYALIMYKLLQTHGLLPNKDYSVKPVGGTPFRRQAVTSGEASAAMLSPPIDSQLEKQGFHILARSSDLGAGQGSVYVVRRSWAKAHRGELESYIRAIVAATDYVFSNKAGTIEVLKKHDPRLKDAQLEALYAELTGSEGLDPRAAINMAGVKNILAIRQEFAEPKKQLGAPSKYIDLTYYQQALAKK
jgi:ABC-type nitrate/sulfonate/bicarbonate transport system substrate-binding protein